eukprot:m.259415 g.259415  ORF g.259415 m.259415 type:complete len:51 (-) comp15553_c0_seq3:1167-1319(-)
MKWFVFISCRSIVASEKHGGSPCYMGCTCGCYAALARRKSAVQFDRAYSC